MVTFFEHTDSSLHFDLVSPRVRWCFFCCVASVPSFQHLPICHVAATPLVSFMFDVSGVTRRKNDRSKDYEAIA